jgi:hypothetical protein
MLFKSKRGIVDAYCILTCARVGNGISFRKIQWNGLGTVSIIPQKKVLIPRFTEESIPKLGTERNYMKKISFTKNPAPANRIESLLSSAKRNSEILLLFLFQGTDFGVVFSSVEWFATEFRLLLFCSTKWNSKLSSLPRNGSEQNSESMLIFVPRYRIPSIFLLCGMVRNGIPRVCLFLFHGTGFRAFFSSLRVRRVYVVSVSGCCTAVPGSARPAPNPWIVSIL